ncbi:hypothetical protein S40293_08096 [Stachybotrys chartarum IBT 40293]|nr:hypothetical protein S40293_08096 [Stachybotrys chartarum IBT 40293]KFA76361.1 hypothetical protein S40288_07119 [Stachybotrys chartarum IBT 40288]
MAGSLSAKSLLGRFSVRVALSYVFDWIVVILVAGLALVLDELEPNKRPFSLADPNISFPFTEHETVPPWLLLVLVGAVPIGGIAVVALLFVPGATVPKDTPRSLVWQRKLWELHVGWLGLALALASAWFFTNGMKNMFGKPRPDLLARCQPDLANAATYIVGGFPGESTLSQLYSADICTQNDAAILDDGFRSYPSGHSSSAAAGLIYLSLFLASKFAVTIPFVASGSVPADSTAHAAFPSRQSTAADPFEAARLEPVSENPFENPQPVGEKVTQNNARHNASIQSLRRQAAAPPVYLLVITLAPFCLGVFIASSRWFDFRHHGFDILFGFLMGTVTAVYSFRYYHLPLQEGAGWAWGPRSEARAFWAGVGKLGYAGEDRDLAGRARHYHRGHSSDNSYRSHFSRDGTLTHRQPSPPRDSESYQEVELSRFGEQQVQDRV